MSSRFKYSALVQADDWRVRETYKSWLIDNVGPRGIDWSFMWSETIFYTVKLVKESDMLAFRLRFAC